MKYINQDDFICKYKDADLTVKLDPDDALISKKSKIKNTKEPFDGSFFLDDEPILHYQEKEKMCMDAFAKLARESKRLCNNIKNVIRLLY